MGTIGSKIPLVVEQPVSFTESTKKGVAGSLYGTGPQLRWFPRQMVVPLTYTFTDSRNLPFTSFYVGVKVNAVGVKVKVAAQWLWGVKVNMGG